MLVRDAVFPVALVELLQSLDIDPYKDGKIYHNGRPAPGRHDYAVWLHFNCSLDWIADFPVVTPGGVTAWLCTGSALGIPPPKGKSRVQAEFNSTNFPWRLAEAEHA